jgi:hypothetical protein
MTRDRTFQPALDLDLPPDTGDRRPLCHLCLRRPADVAHDDGALCGGCALFMFGAFYFDGVLG